ncbi:Uu.00g033790.m01.CDS01 [Anthostomella pinea]|uniref:Mitochondrial distribution and morphology protein 12 n=1 Tax=Anthostomella pinea TaxID=933095 RepID=A0AAI8V8X5_9PEZI|nr:Uu.00g033790.m01.CDS01 [Anthostomella pinea]
MSIDLNWETLTGGPDGEALAERIRDFIHVKFQSVQLPRFIKSVTVHDFAFGSIPPEVVLKDICDPLPDFYEENPDVDGDEEEEEDEGKDVVPAEEEVPDVIKAAERRRRDDQARRLVGPVRGTSWTGGGLGLGAPFGEGGAFPPHIHTAGLRSAPGTPADLGSPFLALGASTPGIPGGTSNMHYFQSKLASGWSGTQTPLAAVAGAQHLNGWLDMAHPQMPPSERYQWSPRRGHGHSRHASRSSSISVADSPSALAPAQTLREKHSVSTLAPTSAGTSRPPTRDNLLVGSAIDEEYDDGPNADSGRRGGRGGGGGGVDGEAGEDEEPKYQEPRVEDMQAVFRIRYGGDVRLELTAEILLDYPMPSFVGIPVKLNITGLTFDGVGVVANIRKRVHFCFLSPEDALAAVAEDDDEEEDVDGHGKGKANASAQKGRLGGLLQEIRVESEIGQREGSKQSLKNVGKVEKFVLEQVRRIFEEEFVYPSFWTFLV